MRAHTRARRHRKTLSVPALWLVRARVCPQDINKLANRGFKMLSANVPAASGFGVAFLLGLNYG